MKKEERDIVDDWFREKLYDFEAEPIPELWKAIADRLPEEPPQKVSLKPQWHYWAAAAVAALLVVSVGLWLQKPESPVLPLANVAEKGSENIPVQEKEAVQVERPVVAEDVTVIQQETDHMQPDAHSLFAVVDRSEASSQLPVEEEVAVAEEKQPAVTAEKRESEPERQSAAVPLSLRTKSATAGETVAATREEEESPKRKNRKWSFGMGAGGVSVGSNSSVPNYVTNSSSLRSESLLVMNSAYFNSETPKTDIRHRMPVSFGLSVSRMLNGRFSLQTGVNYSYLVSDWNTNNDYYVKTKQKLHFIGIPLSLAYKIAEWNRFNFYAAAGGMAEVNVAGSCSSKLFKEEQEVMQLNESVRMKEWLWSLHARAGVSYPLFRFVSAFAEVGAEYYFDNGSAIETIHSEKPFNVDLNIGLRLGF